MNKTNAESSEDLAVVYQRQSVDQAAQPVAWLYMVGDRACFEHSQMDHFHVHNGGYVKGVPLYTAPPKLQPVQTTEGSVKRTCPMCEESWYELEPQPVQAQLNLLSWAVDRWLEEVGNRPLVNKNRRTLDDTWRQVIRFAGGDPDELIGPSHDALLAAEQAQKEE